ncbi:MAG: DUF1631 family protein [Gammaproteobacteria bacterium]
MIRADFDAASAAVRSAILHGDGPLPPAFVIEFLLRAWRDYLALTHSAQGENSDDWHAAIRTAEDLLRSVRPMASARELGELCASVRSLIAELRKGMRIACVPVDRQAAWLQRLGELHLSLMRQAPAEPRAASDADYLDTINMEMTDPRYQRFLQMIGGAQFERIEM